MNYCTKLVGQMESAIISSIKIEDPNSWENKLFLTIDFDWAHDDVLTDTIDLVESLNLCATWFVTHETPLIRRLSKNSKFELGLHPNFDHLLTGRGQVGTNAQNIVDNLLNIIPNSKCVRGHSLTNSSKLQNFYRLRDITHDANVYIPASANISLKPWQIWNGLTIVPHCWEDDIFCTFKDSGHIEPHIRDLIRKDNLTVVGFHPIHIYLNTETMSRYENTRIIHKDPPQLLRHRFEGYGIRSILCDLC